jgi:glutamyl-tRNA(Gln) amidotransferase subunit E
VDLTIDPEVINVKVGMEIHQQLATNRKLFCCSRSKETEKYDATFVRKLRPTQSELGSYDPAVMFEFKKMRTIKYHTSTTSSCLVEADEEPPHDVDEGSLETALLISLALHSDIADELHVMRKIVIDGSNTSGFQRTILVANDGYIDVDEKRVKVQSVCLEEDAAKLISDDGTIKEYGLDRLGVPLVEIALEPVKCTPKEVMRIALTLGRLLRASKRVARGLGSIRQDINISMNEGAVVEVKGVQKLDQLVKVIQYEMVRQHGMIIIAQKLRDAKATEEEIGDKVEDVTEILNKSSSKVVIKTLQENNSIFKAIRVKHFKGMMRFEPYSDIRIGKQLGELVRFYGLGGVFHSDELPGYGINDEEVQAIKNKLMTDTETDAFVLVGGPRDRTDFAIEAIIQRLKMALNGVPPETRAATLEGKTIFSRPRPGAARMYPETDISPIPVNSSRLTSLSEKVPKSMDEVINSITRKYNLNKKLAEQIFDSDYFEIFEKIAGSVREVRPTFIASKLTEDIISLERQGLDSTVLTDEMLIDIFKRLDNGTIAKEGVISILEKLMKKEAKTVEEAKNALGITLISDQELDATIEKILKENSAIINEKRLEALGILMGKSISMLKNCQELDATIEKILKENSAIKQREKQLEALGILMGKSMILLRGRADGHKINSILKNKLEVIPAGIPQIPGQDAPEGFTRNYVNVVKGYFCKFACKSNRDNFHKEDILLNEELRDNARALFNEQTEQEIRNALYDNHSDYSRLVKFVLAELIAQDLFIEEEHEGRDSTYWKTSKLKDLCPKVLKFILPIIDPLVEEYDRQQPKEYLKDNSSSARPSTPN